MRKLVAAVIFNRNKYLMLRRKLHWKGWEFVKGDTEGQGYKKALLREIREETNLRKVRIVCMLPPEIFYHHEDIHGHTSSMQKGFLVEYLGGTIRLSLEHSGYRWVDRKTAEKLLTHTSHKTFLRVADRYVRELEKKKKKFLVEKLSKKHVSLVRFDGKRISLKYDGKKLSNRVVKRTVRVVGDWSRIRNEVYYDKNLDARGVLPILIHETVEKHVAQTYGLDVDTEAHKIAQAVEKEFIADKGWIKIQKLVSIDWVKANKRKVGKIKFY